MGNDNVKDYPPYLDYAKPRKPMTRGDKIRAMTDEELARFIAGQRAFYCTFEDPSDKDYSNMLDWLKQEKDND